jgi:hypothetical protein
VCSYSDVHLFVGGVQPSNHGRKPSLHGGVHLPFLGGLRPQPLGLLRDTSGAGSLCCVPPALLGRLAAHCDANSTKGPSADLRKRTVTHDLCAHSEMAPDHMTSAHLFAGCTVVHLGAVLDQCRRRRARGASCDTGAEQWDICALWLRMWDYTLARQALLASLGDILKLNHAILGLTGEGSARQILFTNAPVSRC